MEIVTKILGIIVIVTILLLFTVGIPLSQYIEYKHWVKKYGKEIADEIARRC